MKILGIKITNISSIELNKKIFSQCKEGSKSLILNVNIHAMNIAYKNEWFKKVLNSAFINFCDGDGVRLGAKILGESIQEKITYNRWIWDFASYSQENDITWYMVGSNSEVIRKAFDVLEHNYPDLKILGYHHGFLGDEDINSSLIADIAQKKPNVLIVGMGMPLQERWLIDNFDKIEFNAALTGGAVFDYISGEAKMTPDIFYKLKLEWFYRFLNEPKRLFKRYFIGNPLFIFRVLLEKVGILKF